MRSASALGAVWEALATGAALAQTSLGFAGKLLTEFGQLQTDTGVGNSLPFGSPADPEQMLDFR